MSDDTVTVIIEKSFLEDFKDGEPVRVETPSPLAMNQILNFLGGGARGTCYVIGEGLSVVKTIGRNRRLFYVYFVKVLTIDTS